MLDSGQEWRCVCGETDITKHSLADLLVCEGIYDNWDNAVAVANRIVERLEGSPHRHHSACIHNTDGQYDLIDVGDVMDGKGG